MLNCSDWSDGKPEAMDDSRGSWAAKDQRWSIQTMQGCGSWQHTCPCTERLCWTADRCPNRYLQHLSEPGSHPHMSQIHNNHTGTKEITSVLSKRLPSHSTDSNHNEVLWEASHAQEQNQPPQHTPSTPVCIPPKPLYGWCNFLYPPPGSYPPIENKDSYVRMLFIDFWLNGVVQTTCPSMWVRQRRLWWTSGETLVTTPHWPSTAQLWRESAPLHFSGGGGGTSQRTSPRPPTLQSLSKKA